jgi:hypothetical protein
VLYEVGGVADYARYENLSGGQLDPLEDMVFVFVPRVGRAPWANEPRRLFQSDWNTKLRLVTPGPKQIELPHRLAGSFPSREP